MTSLSKNYDPSKRAHETASQESTEAYIQTHCWRHICCGETADYHELALDVGVSDRLAVLLQQRKGGKKGKKTQPDVSRTITRKSSARRCRYVSLTHFIKRMLPGEYWTKSEPIPEPQFTQRRNRRSSTLSVDPSPLSPPAFAFGATIPALERVDRPRFDQRVWERCQSK